MNIGVLTLPDLPLSAQLQSRFDVERVIADRYEVRELIGSGGMADVHRAYDQRLSRLVAIKVLRADLARDPSFQTRFRREAQAAAGLNHPSIVSVHDTGTDDHEWGKVPFIVMEYVEGTTIRDVLREKKLPTVTRSLQIVRDILDALDYSHEHGIVHRDIKPGNVMITPDGEIKVMDFGIAKALDDVDATITHAWTVVGTAQYLSPEQARGETADARSDIYATGCLLYELLVGKPPFVAETPVAVAYKHANAVLVPPSKLVSGLPPGLDNVLSHALTKDPALRYQTAALMREDIDRLLAGVRVKAPAEPRRKRTKRSWIIPILLVSLLVAGSATAYLIVTGKIGTSNSAIMTREVSGFTLEEARGALSQFQIVVKRASDLRTPKDRVITQNPPAGSKLPANSTITLTFSDGPGNTTVPTTLLGQPLEKARQILTSAGLVIAQTNPVNSELTPGTVLAVTPVAGSTVQAGSGVTLEVASGNIAVPKVTGMSEIDARTTLISLGFLPNEVQAFDPSFPINTVLAQAPNPGTVKIVGSGVTITINTLIPIPVPIPAPS
jgi:serine/threonine protein kinase